MELDRTIDLAALPENRAGRISLEQLARLRHANDLRAKIIGLAALVLGAVIVISLIGVSSRWPSLVGFPPVVILVMALVPLAALVPFAWRTWRSLAELRAARVEVVEGPIGKRSFLVNESADRLTYLEVGAKRYRAPYELFDRAPEDGDVRLFVLPKSGEIVNYEILETRN